MKPMLALLLTDDLVFIAAGVLVVTCLISLLRPRPFDNSRRLERKLDALLKHQGIQLTSRLSPEVERLARDPSKKIAAIKLHREEHPGLGLAQAKDEVEDFINSPK